MKNYDLEENEENLKLSIEKDCIKRNTKINKLIELLNNITDNKIISIDGKWGNGKTIFLKQLMYMNKNYKTIQSFEEIGYKEEELSKFNELYDVYYYNSWENDSHESPLLSLIYNIINDFPNEKNQTASDKIELPINLIELLKTISGNCIDLNKVESYSDLTESIHTVEERKESLNKLIDSILPKQKRLIIIIDELDRCKPDYAISLLETIKHFYTNKKIVFLLGTNNEQLSHVVSQLYGSNFDGYGYLSKFYNLTIELEDINTDDYLKYVINIPKADSFSRYALYDVCNYFNFSMREINRFLSDYNLLDDVFKSANYTFYEMDRVVKYIFLPLCLGLKIKSKEELSKFFEGNNINVLNDYVFKYNHITSILRKSYNDTETNKVEVTKTDLEFYLKNKYKEFFSFNENNDNKSDKEKFFDIFSLIGNYTKI